MYVHGVIWCNASNLKTRTLVTGYMPCVKKAYIRFYLIARQQKI